MSRDFGSFVAEIEEIKVKIRKSTSEENTTLQSIKQHLEREIQKRLTSLLHDLEPVFQAVLPLHDHNQAKIGVMQDRDDLIELINKNPDFDRENMLSLKIKGAIERINLGHDPATPMNRFSPLLWEVTLLYTAYVLIPEEILDEE